MIWRTSRQKVARSRHRIRHAVRGHQSQQLRWKQKRDYIVIDFSKKQDCSDTCAKALKRAQKWRLELRSKYPDDVRLVKAAKTLERIAGETNELSDEAWLAIEPHFDWCTAHWTNAVSLAARRVEYYPNVRSFSGFVNELMSILQVEA
jgi:hypothetical protein